MNKEKVDPLSSHVYSLALRSQTARTTFHFEFLNARESNLRRRAPA
jgi:hypothetical protein